MRKYSLINIPLLLAVIMLATDSCKKPNAGISVLPALNTSGIFKYGGIIHIRDAANSANIPANASVTFAGQDANYLYDLGGTKNFSVNNGDVQFMVDPGHTIQGIETFFVQVSAPGYLPVTEQIALTPSRLTQQVLISMINLSQPPAGYQIAGASFSLNAGVMPLNGIMQLSPGGVTSYTESSTTQARPTNVSGDSTYYDDGLTSVVLPEGTGFYSYQLVQTGSQTVITDSATRLITDTVQLSPALSKTYERLETYYDLQTNTYPLYQWEQVPFTGDTVKVVAFYCSGGDVTTSAYLYGDCSAPNIASSIGLVNGSLVPEDELLFKSAVQLRLTSIVFVGIQNGKPVIISPYSSYNWFTSFRLNSNYINPQTGNPIAAGDSLEIGIDPSSLQTVRQAITSVNGQLRAQIQSTDMGFYYQAPYVSSFSYYFNTYTTPYPYISKPYPFNYDPYDYNTYNYNYNPSPYNPHYNPYFNTQLNSSFIPDGENLFCYTLVDGIFKAVWSPNTGYHCYSGKVCSASPINTSSSMTDCYWNKNILTEALSNNLFADISLSSTAYPLSTYNITVEKAGSGVPVQPTGWVSATADSSTISGGNNMYMQNGYWATRGVPINTPLREHVNYGNYIFDSTFEVGPANTVFYTYTP